MRSKYAIGMIALVIVAVAIPAQADFFLHNTLDLSDTNLFGTPLFNDTSGNGDNPSALTTDGDTIWVAGVDNGNGTSAGIVKIESPFSGTPTATTLPGSVEATANTRGYSGLAYDYTNNIVFASFDAGAASANGISGWSGSTDANLWVKNARGGSGVGPDPGFGGVDSGAGWTTFGSGRRALQNGVSGADIYTTADGMIINGAGTGTFWRDMDYAPDGDIWLREGNNLISANRTGGNSIDAPLLVVDEPEADFVSGQNLAYLHGLGGGDIVVYNDRESSSGGQLFSLVMKAVLPDGTDAGISFLAGDGSPLDILFAQGAGYYDYEWDEASQTLLVLDFSNRSVYQFKTEVVPEPASLALLIVGGLVIARRRG